MQMVSPAEAFGGRWVSSPLAWLLLLFPVMLLVVVQEAMTPFPSALYMLGSALAQHTIASVVSILLLTALRRRWPVVPVVAAFVVWIIAGVLRGLVGGIIADLFAGIDPDYAYRIIYWVVITVVWGPLLTYVFAQAEMRRALSTELATVTESIHGERERGHRSVNRLTNELVASVRDAVRPLVADVRSRLELAAAHDQEMPLESISERLEFISHEARSIIDHPRYPEPEAVARPTQPSSPLVESLTFDRSRPIFASLLTAVALSALVLPDAVHAGGAREALEATIAVLAGAATMLLCLLLARRARTFTAAHAALIFSLAAAAAVGSMLVIENYPISPRDLSLLLALPIGFILSAATLSAAVGIAIANLNLLARLDEQQSELDELRNHSRAREERIAAQVNEILHGPILGRLSACVMALNFFLAEPDHSRGLRRKATTEGVLAHLELITHDLEKLTNSQGRSARTL